MHIFWYMYEGFSPQFYASKPLRMLNLLKKKEWPQFQGRYIDLVTSAL